ncbi:MAG: HNH endonuclease signature motif containing protein [Bacteriovoracaceae bacterium]
MQLTQSEMLIHNKIKTLVITERATLVQILDQLQIVYDTRLYAKMGHASIIKYLIKEHGYSESAAYRRMQALRLVKEIPEVKNLVKKGNLHLSGITTLQIMMKNQDKDTKIDVISKIQNKTNSEIQTEIFKLIPTATLPNENSRKVSETETRLSLNLSQKVMDKLEKLKARTKCYDTALIIEKALDIALSSTDVTKTKTIHSKGSNNPRTIPAKTKKEILMRSNQKCEYPGCESIHFLEFDHIKAVSQGGTNEKKNIRLLCKAHNQFYAINRLGMRHMKSYFK